MRVRYALRHAVLVSALLLAPDPTSAGPPRGAGNQNSTKAGTGAASVVGMTILPTFNAQALAECLLGPTITVNSATLTAAPEAVGAFTTGTDVLGITSGVVLSTGDIGSLARANQFEDTSWDNQTPGDPSLEAVLEPNGTVFTFDAAVLTIDFTVAAPATLDLSYVFGSEEYNEYVDDAYNDVFAIFLDGTAPAQNIALTGGACATNTGLTVAINNVNCGIDGTNTSAPNCPCFRDNTGNTIETELDGLTLVFVASASLSAGPHTLKVAIADAADPIYDAAVFIKCQVGEVPTRATTWGQLKTIYR